MPRQDAEPAGRLTPLSPHRAYPGSKRNAPVLPDPLASAVDQERPKVPSPSAGTGAPAVADHITTRGQRRRFAYASGVAARQVVDQFSDELGADRVACRDSLTEGDEGISLGIEVELLA